MLPQGGPGAGKQAGAPLSPLQQGVRKLLRGFSMRRCILAVAICAVACGRYSATTATVTVAVSGPGGVRTSQLQGDCRATCWFAVARENPVHLEPVLDPNAVFTGWTGACNGTGPCDLKPQFDVSVAATFTPARPHRVQVSLSGDGEVRSDPAGIDCPRTCAADFPEGTAVALQALPSPGWDFNGFGGACVGQGCTLAVLADTAASATFSQRPPTLVVQVSGSGSIVSTPAAIDCPRICSATFAPDAAVTLSASAAPGFSFVGFSGDCTGSTCALRLSGPANVSATFSSVPVFKLSVALSGNGVGRVTSAPAGIDCPGACTALVPEGTSMVLSAAADALSKFRGYDGSCTGAACALTVKADASVVAAFDPRRYLAVDLGVPAGGTWSSPISISPHKELVAGAWGGAQRIFFWDGAMHDSGTAEGTPSAVNDSGVVVGSAPAGAASHAFRWQSGTAVDLGTLGGADSFAAALNGDGTIAGGASGADGVMRAAAWTAKGIVDLGSMGTGVNGCSSAWGINSGGVAVGESCTPAAGVRAARFHDGAVDDLGSLGGYTRARSINDKGQIVGFSYLPSGVYHGFIYADGKLLDAGTAGGKKNSDLFAVNGAGIAVGGATDGDGVVRGVVFGAGRMIELDAVTDGTTYSIAFATGIDEAGNIVVQGLGGGASHALLLCPQ